MLLRSSRLVASFATLPLLACGKDPGGTVSMANARLHAAQHGEHVVLAFTADTAVHVATLDLTALP